MTTTKLHATLSTAGLPIVSVRKLGDGSFAADIDNGTPEQYAQAQAIINGFDVEKEAHNAAIDAQIATLEKRELAPRFNREATLVMLAKFYMAEKSVDFATAVSQMTAVGNAGYNAGFSKLKALDDQIRALRAQRQP